MDIDRFLKQFVEGYLLHDLESMSKITLPDGQNDGAVGYPMVSTTLAGMELLGGLLMPNIDPFDANKGSDYFLNYWNNYFINENPAYTGLGRLFRQLMRNGISHTFVAKPGIMVEKGTNRQMSVDTTRQEVYIDCNVFYKEFEKSYKNLVRPIVDGTTTSPSTTKAQMQSRLDDLSRVYSDDSVRLFTALPTLHTSTINTPRRSTVPVSPFFTSPVGISGASLSMPSTTTTTSSSSRGVPPSSVTPPFISISGTLPPKKR